MTQLPTTETLRLTLGPDGWLTVLLNRPESRNALSAQMADELTATFEAIAPDRAVRGVTLRGAAGTFCSGGDLKGFKSDLQGGDGGVAAAAAANAKGGELYDLINEAPQPVIALVEGAAMAGGLGMVCCADLVAVTETSKYALTETKLGFPPAQIAHFVVERVGLAAARRLTLTAARFDGTEAGRIGIADVVVADAAGLEAQEAAWKADILATAPAAAAWTKRLLFSSRRLSRADQRALAGQGFGECLMGPEGREGVASFIEKRRPAWAVSNS
ncbi:MAG: enoyl-CoA hydratase/isomerase family protein [Pseudomonadota bacterium]|nr:enoyl-CoA hydratase/isomerase family protein [Pseudomonadota bacterium]